MPYISFKDYPGKKYKCSVRLLRICSDNRIQKLAALADMTYNDFKSLPECGPVTAKHVKKMLKDNGLDFRKKETRKKHFLKKARASHDHQQIVVMNPISGCLEFDTEHRLNV